MSSRFFNQTLNPVRVALWCASFRRCGAGVKAGLGIGVFAVLALALGGTVGAQQLQPVIDDDAIETSNLDIQKIYNLTEVARGVEDYERIIARSERLLKQEIAPKDAKYLISLVAWSRNRLGQKHLQNSISMRAAGLTKQADEELERAIRHFDSVIVSSPMTWRSWMGRARIHAMVGEYEAALEKFIEVTKLKRDHFDAWFNAAEICLFLKRYDEAIEFYDRLVKEDPTDVQSLTGRGHACLALQEFPSALDDYKTVVKLQPHNENALCNLGDAYVRVEMWREALEQFEAASKLEVGKLGKTRLAECLVNCTDDKWRDVQRSITLTSRLIDQWGPSHSLLNTLADAYTANGQTDMAKEVLMRAEKMADSNVRQASTKSTNSK